MKAFLLSEFNRSIWELQYCICYYCIAKQSWRAEAHHHRLHPRHLC